MIRPPLFLPCFSCGLFIVASLTATTRAEPHDPKFQELIRRLDSDSYKAREAATETLIGHGRAAIPAVAEAAASKSPEVSWRAASILERIGLDGDEVALREVIQALHELETANPNRSFKKGAAQLFDRWKLVRHQRATSRLQHLGAQVEQSIAAWGLGGGFIVDAPVLGVDVAFDPFGEEEMVEVEEPFPPAEADAAIVEFLRRPRAEGAAPDEADAGRPATEEAAPEELKPDEPAVVVAEKPVVEEPPAGDDPAIPPAEAVEEGGEEVVIEDPPVATERLVDLFVEERLELVEPVEIDLGDFDDVVVPDLDLAGEFIMGGDLIVWDDAQEVQPSWNVTIDKNWKGDSDDLRYLKDLRQLSTLTIENVSLSNRGAAWIAQLSNLKRLSLKHATFDRDTLIKLKQTRPDLSIYATGETLLGVSGESQPQGFLVTHVVSGSGAYQSGIKIGDVLTLADGVELKSLDELTIAIAHKKVGEKLPVTYLRDNNKHSTVVILGAREPGFAPLADDLNVEDLDPFAEEDALPLRDP